MQPNDASLIQPGDRAPSCYGMTGQGKFYSSEEQYGRASVLILAGAAAGPELTRAIGVFASTREAFAARNTDVLLVIDDNPSSLRHVAGSIQTIDCGDFLARCGVGTSDVLVLVLDRNLRVAMCARPDAINYLAAVCLDCIERLPYEPPRDARQPAPVILLPNLLPPALCRTLIDRFESGCSIEGEVARIDAAGNECSVVDHTKKHRRDMAVPPEMHDMVQDMLLRRCAPEIAKAFQVRVAYTDRILLSRYDDSGGWFRRHRDNAAPQIAFREFALSVNLNAEDYSDGHLLFPEYNDNRYKPPTGAGAIFSTGVLHEAAPVTRGRRYVLLTFLHSEAAEIRRLSYAASRALAEP